MWRVGMACLVGCRAGGGLDLFHRGRETRTCLGSWNTNIGPRVVGRRHPTRADQAASGHPRRRVVFGARARSVQSVALPGAVTGGIPPRRRERSRCREGSART
ncbi:hypothetical protein GCM10010483_20290 [Actinokineospora diospyrosa]